MSHPSHTLLSVTSALPEIQPRPGLRSGTTPGREYGTASGLRLNLLTAWLRGTLIHAGEVAYQSREQLDALRAEHGATHIALRNGQAVRLVPVTADAALVGRPVTLPVDGDGIPVVARLLQEALKRFVVTRWPYELKKDYPPVFVSRLKADLLDDSHRSTPSTAPFHVYPEFRLDGRYLSQARTFGVILGIKSRYEIDLNVSELIELGLDITDRYILGRADPRFPGQDPRYARKMLGVVRSVRGGVLLVDGPTGTVEVPAGEVWLEARRENFEAAFECAAGHRARQLLAELEGRISRELTGGKARLDRTRSIADKLGQHGPLLLTPGVEALIGLPLGDSGSGRVLMRKMPEPTFVFDLAGDKTARFPETGLQTHGPFDAEQFTPKIPHIVVVAPARYKGSVEQVLSSFRDGIKGSGFPDGFLRRYRLTNLRISIVTFDGSDTDAAAYRRACVQALNNYEKIDLAFVIISNRQEALVGDASPYLVAKSTFMSQSIPVQEFQIENFQRADFSQVLRNVSLAVYAKLGGIPYLVRVPHRPLVHELVIGIGSAEISARRLGPVTRTVGITTVFDVDGNYLVSNTSREADYDTYPAALLEALRRCIDDVKARNAWQRDDAVRLVFHVFKPMKDAEARAVKRLVEELAKDFVTVEFAFLHVADDHDWMLFDPSNNGIVRGNRPPKGAGIPQRGCFVRLSRREVLITSIGPGDLKTSTQGAPRPMLLKLHRESTFDDLEYLADQLFRFTTMSWRRPFPSAKPVTILYSELIARLLGQLRGVTNWNSDLINTRLQRSRWFL